jgi:hypothetical protein
VTIHGPIGPKPGYDLPSENWGIGPAICTVRSERSWPTVRPATCAQAFSAATCSATRPITATSSTSQSTVELGSSIVADGPVRQVGNFVKTAGESGADRPDSAAWSR